jgi:hypothetical protein
MAHRKRVIDKDPVTALLSPVDKSVRCKQPVDGVVVDVALNHQHVHLASSRVRARSESEHGAKRHMRFAHMITKGHKVGHTLEQMVGHTLERTIGHMVGHTEYVTSKDTHSNRCWTNGRNMAGRVAG